MKVMLYRISNVKIVISIPTSFPIQKNIWNKNMKLMITIHTAVATVNMWPQNFQDLLTIFKGFLKDKFIPLSKDVFKTCMGR